MFVGVDESLCDENITLYRLWEYKTVDLIVVLVLRNNLVTWAWLWLFTAWYSAWHKIKSQYSDKRVRIHDNDVLKNGNVFPLSF